MSTEIILNYLEYFKNLILYFLMFICLLSIISFIIVIIRQYIHNTNIETIDKYMYSIGYRIDGEDYDEYFELYSSVYKKDDKVINREDLLYDSNFDIENIKNMHLEGII